MATLLHQCYIIIISFSDLVNVCKHLVFALVLKVLVTI